MAVTWTVPCLVEELGECGLGKECVLEMEKRRVAMFVVWGPSHLKIYKLVLPLFWNKPVLSGGALCCRNETPYLCIGPKLWCMHSKCYPGRGTDHNHTRGALP